MFCSGPDRSSPHGPGSVGLVPLQQQKRALAHITVGQSAGSPLPWDLRICRVAAEYKHLHILQWARAQQPPCPWNSLTFFGAARHGHTEILQGLIANDCPIPQHPTCIVDPLCLLLISDQCCSLTNRCCSLTLVVKEGPACPLEEAQAEQGVEVPCTA